MLLRKLISRLYSPEGDGGTGGGAGGSNGGGAGGSNGGGTGGAGGASNNDGGAGTGAGGASGGAPAVWYDALPDGPGKEWIKSYGDAYKTGPAAVVDKAFNLEKFVGAEKAGRGVIIPKADATPEEQAAFWRKVGAPEKPDGYKLSETVLKDPVIVKIRDKAHTLGVPKQQFEALIGLYESEAAALIKGQETIRAQAAEQEMTALYAEWQQAGMKDQNIELSRRAVASFIPGKTKEEKGAVLSKIEAAIGAGNTMRLFANIGAGLGEHAFLQGENAGNSSVVTPEAARIKIKELQSDKAWSDKFIKGDADAKAEWTRLHKIAYPEQSQQK